MRQRPAAWRSDLLGTRACHNVTIQDRPFFHMTDVIIGESCCFVRCCGRWASSCLDCPEKMGALAPVGHLVYETKGFTVHNQHSKPGCCCHLACPFQILFENYNFSRLCAFTVAGDVSAVDTRHLSLRHIRPAACRPLDTPSLISVAAIPTT